MVNAKLLDLLGNWTTGRGPIYRRLAAALRRGIVEGSLAPGIRLPAERQLARTLAVSRTTVVAAYEELRQEGRLESRRGSGTRVAAWASPPGPSPAPPAGVLGMAGNSPWPPAFSVGPSRGSAGGTGQGAGMAPSPAGRRPVALRTLVEPSGAAVEFLGMHLPAVEPYFGDAIAHLAADLEPLLRNHGYLWLGLPALRQAIAARLTATGLPTAEEQVLVTHGAQQAIGLAAALYLRPGDPVVLEDPTYLGAIDVFSAAGARLVPVPLGGEGVDLDRLRAAVTGEAPRLVYLMPTCHNPAGTVVPEDARREIVRLAEESGVPVVEDNTLADLDLGPHPPPPLAAFARRAPILTVGSLSKLAWAGLRIGWIRAEAPLIARLARRKALADLGCSIVPQAIAARLLGEAEAIRQVRRQQAELRLRVLEEELARALPLWRWRRPSGGLALWVRLPVGNAAELARVALRHGVAFLPGSACSPTGGCADYMRLPFVLDPPDLRDGVARLARAWSAYLPLAHSPEPSPASLDVLV
ncbi:MAG TPA: PLP-dependent aminotransferase family protein [Thermoanaerobaculia bacterium]|nr:PLP-dependent aminotransferase family protein [Thermoanaerobaculia bacterium]